jgi:hypothetical protein
MKKYQRGFINIPDGTFEALFVFAAIGLVAAVVAVGYSIYWLFNHIAIV